MKKYILDYIKELEEKINNNYKFTSKDIEEIKYKIENFKHERLIHLLVTLFYALFVISFIFLSIFFIYFIVPCFILIIFLFFYVKHYFLLENSVQYLYNRKVRRKNGKSFSIKCNTKIKSLNLVILIHI